MHFSAPLILAAASFLLPLASAYPNAAALQARDEALQPRVTALEPRAKTSTTKTKKTSSKTKTSKTKTSSTKTAKSTSKATTTAAGNDGGNNGGGSGGATNTNLQKSFPSPTGTTLLAQVTTIAKSFDGKMALFDRKSSTCSEQAEGGDADAVFLLEDGATLSNVIIGPNNGEGVHCLGSCTLNNVWWQDVCEDAATFKQTSGTSYVNGGGAKGAADKVFQHNGGGTVSVKNFYASGIGKLYRSCGNCKTTQYKRTSIFDNIYVSSGKLIAGVNSNYGDVTTIKNSCLSSVKAVCDIYQGNNSGKEPTKLSSGPDGKSCIVENVKTSGC